MKYTIVKNEIRKLCCIIAVLAIAAGIAVISVYGASNGIYLAAATPHYAHPVTGEVEDGGDSGALGQSMSESVTGRTALVEVDPEGNTYVTVRLQLMDNIENPRFMVDGSSVSATLMQEDYGNNSADYRMAVNDEDSIICCKMYVTAMGRDVVFFITVSDLQSGSGDFITSVEVRESVLEEDSKSTETAKTDSLKKEEKKETKETVESEVTDEDEVIEQTSEDEDASKETTDEDDVAAQTSEIKDASEETINKATDEVLKGEEQPETMPIVGIVAVFVLAAIGGTILYKKKK